MKEHPNETMYYKYKDIIGSLDDFGKFLYIVNPYKTTFKNHENIPDYQEQVWFPFLILIFMEHVILLAKREKSFRLNDQVTSLSHWILQETGRVFFRGVEYYAYIVIHEKCCIWNLAWDSLWTWYITAIAVDFCYYWAHRANHEVHFLWAHHQVHHSSEEFNLTVGLRQSVLQQWCNFMFYLPLALFIPPSHFIVHHQFNLIYQLWIHTTVIRNLGPLELIFNTPKHHRVHHGSNLYCLDKNYGGALIIWDRLFGSFAEERPNEQMFYSLVVVPKTFNPLYLQVFYAKSMIYKCLNTKTMKNKLGVLWKGPSWLPGLPRLGLDEFKVNVTSRVKYDPQISVWKKVYITVHFIIVFYIFIQFLDNNRELHNLSTGISIVHNICTLTIIGLLFDKRNYATVLEFLRCLLSLVIIKMNYIDEKILTHSSMTYIYVGSCFIWILDITRNITMNHRNA